MSHSLVFKIQNSKFKIIFLIFYVVFCFTSYSQSKRANHWFIGFGTHIDFNFSPPKITSEGKNHSSFAATSISDTVGKLLFYTDGETVWQADHYIMKNGSGLKGTRNSARSALIIPFPRNPHKYFLFTSDGNGPGDPANGLRFPFYNDTIMTYSIVDMSNGKGEVLNKNTFFLKKAVGHMTALKHANNKDYWLIVKEMQSKTMRVFLINECGITQTSIFESEFFNRGYNYNNGIVSSPQNNKFAITGVSPTSLQLSGGRIAYIYDFDNLNGVITKEQLIPVDVFDYNELYIDANMCFSPNGKYLYAQCTETRSYAQFDLDAPNVGATYNRVHLPFQKDTAVSYNGIQLAPNQKMYVIKEEEQAHYLIEINATNRYINVKDFKKASDSLRYVKYYDGGDPIFLGAYQVSPFFDAYMNPTYKEYIYESPQITKDKRFCYKDTISLNLKGTKDIKTASWSMDNGKTWSLADSANKPFKYYFSKPGNFNIKIALRNICFEDTLEDNILILDSLPSVNLGDEVQCFTANKILNAGNGYLHYSWSSGDTLSELNISKEGAYKIEVENKCGSAVDSVFMIKNENVTKISGNRVCVGTATTFELTKKWFINDLKLDFGDGNIKPFQEKYIYNSSGIYKIFLKADYQCFSDTATTQVIVDDTPLLNLGDSILTCKEEAITLDAGKGFSNYLWQDGSKNQTFTAQPFKG